MQFEQLKTNEQELANKTISIRAANVNFHSEHSANEYIRIRSKNQEQSINPVEPKPTANGHSTKAQLEKHKQIGQRDSAIPSESSQLGKTR